MSVSHHAIYWGAYLGLALLTLVVFAVIVVLSKTLKRSCDPFRDYVAVSQANSSLSHEEIAMQEKALPPPQADSDDKV